MTGSTTPFKWSDLKYERLADVKHGDGIGKAIVIQVSVGGRTLCTLPCHMMVPSLEEAMRMVGALLVNCRGGTKKEEAEKCTLERFVENVTKMGKAIDEGAHFTVTHDLPQKGKSWDTAISYRGSHDEWNPRGQAFLTNSGSGEDKAVVWVDDWNTIYNALAQLKDPTKNVVFKLEEAKESVAVRIEEVGDEVAVQLAEQQGAHRPVELELRGEPVHGHRRSRSYGRSVEGPLARRMLPAHHRRSQSK